MTEEPAVRPLPRLVCCRAYAEHQGLSEEALCPSCADYRHYLHDVRYKEPSPVIPEGFAHTMYSAFEETRNGTEQPKARRPAPARRRRGKREAL